MSDQHIRAAAIDDVAFGKREITLVAVPYNEEATVFDWGGDATKEKFVPGAFTGIESRVKHITLNRDHERSRVIGVAQGFDTKNTRGLIATMKVSNTDLGTESLQLAADGVLRASIAFTARSQDMAVKDGVRSIYRAFLNHIALTPEPAYEGAEVIDVRSGEPIADVPTPNLDAAAAILRELQNASR
jgi:HK97 family phage prohead protease